MADDGFPTPEWVYDAVFYHIFVDRFANGDPSNDPEGTVPWGSEPTPDCYMGGDLQGVINSLSYLEDLGVSAIYFNPIFQAKSNHKFDHGDYMRVDPHFGTNDLLKRLVDEAHACGIRVILDISQNHSGREFSAFIDVVEKGELSPYKDWYHFESFPVSGPENPNYKAWWGIGTLPEFNNDNPEVREYFWEVTRYWMEGVGIDGWRLDVANEVSHDYWREWRKLVKSINPEAYIVGEIWGDGSPWLQGDNFDAVMNYVWRDLIIAFFAKRTTGPSGFDRQLQELRERHPTTVNRAMFNLLGSHDTARFLTVTGGHIERLKLALAFQMSYVGAPVIYYGDEIGMAGEKDPGCRGAFCWDSSMWNASLHRFVRTLTRLRRRYQALRSPEYRSILKDDDQNTYVYRRGVGQESVYVVINNSPISSSVRFEIEESNSTAVTDLITDRSFTVENGEVDVVAEPWQPLYLKG